MGPFLSAQGGGQGDARYSENSKIQQRELTPTPQESLEAKVWKNSHADQYLNIHRRIP